MAGKVQRVYCTALFELGVESNMLDAFSEQMRTASKVFETTPEFVKLLSAPTVSAEEKSKMITTVFAGRFDKSIESFIHLLTDNGRIAMFEMIADEFIKMYNEHNNILEVTATTSISLSRELRDKLKAKLGSISGKNIVLVEKLDPSILGGIVLSYENTRLDASVKGKLEKMKSQINSIIA